ncbi:MAG: PQQ-binding-like beta-propeller repeat protein [Acidobacteriota bacterium]|nr:PQQ-binding-like beta-propeller repeat protein [Acidobacteriota bacterium]
MRAVPLLVLLLAAAPLGAGSDWPNWRGPLSSGVSPDTGVPLRWTAVENIVWKAPLAGVGVSSPIVAGDRVFVTSQIGAGRRQPGSHPRLAQGGGAAGAGERALAAVQGADTLFVVQAFDRKTGALAWEHRTPAVGQLPGVHDKHNMASPSPVSDGRTVFAWFATGQIMALGPDGTVVWQRHLGQEIAPFDINWGHSSSPVLHGNLLILLCDHAPASYLLALDKTTGRQVWKADRGRGRSSYSTPIVVEVDGRPEVIVNSSERVDAYDARDGALLWHVGGSNSFPIPVPSFEDGILYMSRGYRSGPYMAVRAGGRGDVSRTHVLWEVPTGAPYVSSLIQYRGRVFMANDVGVLTVIDAKTGRRLWQERTAGVFSASPVAADGRVYFLSETGETVVVSAENPAIIATNDLGDRALASPAIADGRLFIRTDGFLYAVGSAN